MMELASTSGEISSNGSMKDLQLIKNSYKDLRARWERKVQQIRLSAPDLFTDAPLFQTIYVDPRDIRVSLKKGDLHNLKFPRQVKLTRDGYFDPVFCAGLVLGGDWHSMIVSYEVEAFPLYEALKKRFLEGYEWREIAFYHKAIENVNKGRKYWNGCRSVADVNRRCEKVDKLWSSVMEFGMLPADPPLTVNIGPKGEFIKNTEGRHRLMISTIMGIKVPVQVIVRHEEWQEVRRRARSRDSISAEHSGDICLQGTHPDLQFIP